MNKVMKKLILASNNKHKIDEIKAILSDLPIEVRSLKEENIDIDVEEDGKTFKENAEKKANEIADFLKRNGESNFIVLADDSGLEVDYLNGEPGIYSARYSGIHGDDKKNNEKLLKKLKGVPFEKRGASFICYLVLVTSDDKVMSIKGEVRGVILEELSSEGGFGYDPLFYYEPLEKTFSEIAGSEKNRVSHRGKALEKLKENIKEIL